MREATVAQHLGGLELGPRICQIQGAQTQHMSRQLRLDEAIEWVRRCPNPHPGECEIEIRPVFEADDFGAALTPELREQEARLRAATGAQAT